MKHQWMPMFWGDFFANTLNLTTAAEVGAYVLLIAHAWEHGGRIPCKDAQKIARIDNLHWRKTREKLEPFFEFETDVHGTTWMYSKRILRELALADKLINKRKASGMAGAMKRWGKNITGAIPGKWQTQCDTNGNLPKKERKKEREEAEAKKEASASSFLDAARAREEPPPEKQESGTEPPGADPPALALATAPPEGGALASAPSPEQVAKKAKKQPSRITAAELVEIYERKRNGKAAP